MATLQTGAANSYLLLDERFTRVFFDWISQHRKFYMTFVLAQQRLWFLIFSSCESPQKVSGVLLACLTDLTEGPKSPRQQFSVNLKNPITFSSFCPDISYQTRSAKVIITILLHGFYSFTDSLCAETVQNHKTLLNSCRRSKCFKATPNTSDWGWRKHLL